MYFSSKLPYEKNLTLYYRPQFGIKLQTKDSFMCFHKDRNENMKSTVKASLLLSSYNDNNNSTHSIS